MKTMINLTTGQLKAVLQLMFERVSGTPVQQYSFQPMPSYWEMKPVSREMILHSNKY